MGGVGVTVERGSAGGIGVVLAGFAESGFGCSVGLGVECDRLSSLLREVRLTVRLFISVRSSFNSDSV